MAVAVQAQGTPSSTGGTALTNTSLTIPSGATALLVTLSLFSGTTLASSVAVTWGGTAMTLVGSITNSATGDTVVQYWGLLNPATGNQTISAVWTGAVAAVMFPVSFTGTATDTLANAFKNATTNTGSGTSATVTGTSSPGNINVAQLATENGTTSALSATGGSTNLFNQGSVFVSATTVGSAVWSGTLSVTGAWALLSLDVSAPVSVATAPHKFYSQMFKLYTS